MSTNLLTEDVEYNRLAQTLGLKLPPLELGSELVSFAKKAAPEDYEAVPRSKVVQTSDLNRLISLLQRFASGISQVLVLLVVIGIVFHVAASVSSSDGSPNLRSPAPRHGTEPWHVPMVTMKPPTVAAVPFSQPSTTASGPSASAFASATPQAVAAPQEITDVETSRYNHDYFCTVKRARQTGPNSLALDFMVLGDHTLGNLQDPMRSTLRWQGGSTKPTKHTYEVDDLKHEVIEGTLFYDGVPQGIELDFEFGSSGYSWVKLPIALKPQVQSHIATLDGSN